MKKPIRLVKLQSDGTWMWTTDAIELTNKIYKYLYSLYAKYDEYDEPDLRLLITSSVDETLATAGMKRYVRKLREADKKRKQRRQQKKRKKSRS